MNKEQKIFTIVTLGCRTNQYESQAFQDGLLANGWREAKKTEKADLCIVNTCTVTSSADASSRHAIKSVQKAHPNAKIVVTGCSVEQQPDAIAAMGNLHIVRNKYKETLLQDLYPEERFPEFSIQRFSAHTRAFVKVQDGCNSFCSYCIIPYVRGRSRSRTVEQVVQEVQELVKNGYREIVLTGINIGDFDGGGGACLADLVRVVDQIPGVDRLRISSIDPDEVDDQLLDAVINGKNTAPSMHIVLQAGSNVVLKKMNRKYTRQMFLDSVERLQAADPDFTFTTDIIVGFPGETDADFQDTLDVVERVQFAKVHMFPYSDRARTKANLFKDKIPSDVIKERKAILLQRAEKAAFALRKRYVGKTMQVLTEAEDQQGSKGHTANFLRVELPNVSIPANQLVSATIVENTPQGLVGVL